MMNTIQDGTTIYDLLAAIPATDPRRALIDRPQFKQWLQELARMPTFGGSGVFEKQLNAVVPGLLPEGYYVEPRTGRLVKEMSTAKKALLVGGTLAAPFLGFAAGGGFGGGSQAPGGPPTTPPARPPSAPPGAPGVAGSVPGWLQDIIRGGAGLAVGQIGSGFGGGGDAAGRANSLEQLIASMAPNLQRLSQLGVQRAESSQPLYDQVMKIVQGRLPNYQR